MSAKQTSEPFFRTWQGWFVAVVVASQLVIPLRYYLASRDPHDERFAWRMFSPMRMAQCAPEVTLDDKPFALGTEFHAAWIELAKRGRFRVLEQIGARLCERHPGSAVVVKLRCKYIDRDPVEYGGYDICNVPQL